MAPRKDDTASVATFADHEVITPPNELRKVLAPAAAGDDDPVARAEAALVALSSEFASMDGIRMRAPRSGAPGRQAAGLYRAARTKRCSAPRTTSKARPRHSAIRRRPASPKACAGFSNTRPEIGRIPIALVDQHVDAVRAITREYARPDARRRGRRADASACARSPTISSSRKTLPAGLSGKYLFAAARAG